jgi:hypothetical protein
MQTPKFNNDPDWYQTVRRLKEPKLLYKLSLSILNYK